MQSRARALGHPIHPTLVVFPLGLFTAAVAFDIVHLVTDRAEFAEVAYWNIAAGIVGGLLAAVFGLVDWLAIPAGTRAKRIGLLHGGGNVLIVVLFAVSWLYRRGEEGHAVEGPWLVLELVAIALSGVTGWLGGELVDRLGVGVHDNAHPDAPSSLRPVGGQRPPAR